MLVKGLERMKLIRVEVSINQFDLGFESEDDYYDDDYYDEEEAEDEENARVKRSSQQSAPKKTFSKVVPINPTSSSRIKIMRPSDINDSTNVANEIKEGRLVIFDVGQIDNEEALNALLDVKQQNRTALKEYLEKEGIEHATINLGGNVLTIGTKPDGSDYKIGIQKPFAADGEVLEVLSVHDRSVVSSGDYERYFEKDGVIYHHILDPQSGWPVQNDLDQVTILSDSSADGDALSTTCYVLGLEKGMKLIQEMDDVEAIFVTKDGEIHRSY